MAYAWQIKFLNIVQQLLYTVKIFIKHWIAIFGARKTVFLENGEEFVGESFVEIREKFNIKIKTTPSRSR